MKSTDPTSRSLLLNLWWWRKCLSVRKINCARRRTTTWSSIQNKWRTQTSRILNLHRWRSYRARRTRWHRPQCISIHISSSLPAISSTRPTRCLSYSRCWWWSSDWQSAWSHSSTSAHNRSWSRSICHPRINSWTRSMTLQLDWLSWHFCRYRNRRTWRNCGGTRGAGLLILATTKW